jgi:dedicator of cytokinesis protein 3
MHPAIAGDEKVSKADEPDVYIGIFPASHIYIRDELPDNGGELERVAGALKDSLGSHGNGHFLSHDPYAMSPWPPSRPGTMMETLPEEDEDDALEKMRDRKSFRLGPPPDQATSSRAGLVVRTPSVRSVSPPLSENHVQKTLPPRPSLKSGDDTRSGSSQPIIDEIASALREWHSRMFTYLARRNYALFHTVRDHIEALHLGRRQLLAQTLSTEETLNLRRDCVIRLVSGNVVQNLDVIVRHPDGGGLVTVDVEGKVDQRSWMSAIRMYVMQVALAYIEVAASGPKASLTSPMHKALTPSISSPSALPNSSVIPVPTPAASAFPEGTLPARPASGSRPSTYAPPQTNSIAKFYHVYLEVRAFVASPCSKGETAELYFSLFRKSENRFLTEEFCAVLNHNGVLARDPTASRPVATLFTDFAQHDVQDPIYLVCHIVRKGAMRMSTDPGGADFARRSSTSKGSRGEVTTPSMDQSSTTTAVSTIRSQTSDYEMLASPNGVNGSSSHSTSHFRRPFGCAVLELSQLGKMAAENSNVSSTKEHSMPIFVPIQEAAFSTLHQDLVENRTKEFEKSSR